MPRATPLQPSLNAGEFSPRMVARTDFDKYPLGCATLENMIPLPQGGAARRPGTRFVAAVKDQTKKPRLLAFEFSTAQAYIIECGESYFRFFKDQGQITVADTAAAITNGTFTSDITGWTNQSTGSASISHDATNLRLNLAGAASSVAWAEQQVTNTDAVDHVIRFRILGAPGDKVKLRIGAASTGAELVNDVVFATGFHCYTFTATAADFYVQFRNEAAKTLQVDDVSLIDGAPVDIADPYLESELFGLKTAQSADTMYVCHTAHPVYTLTRTGHTNWSLSEVMFTDGPWLKQNTTATTFAPSATSGLGITLTASSTEGVNGGDGFLASDIGRQVRINNPASGENWGHAVITGVSSTTVVTADVKTAFATTTAKADWRLGSWCATCGYPAAVGFFEQRLAFAANTNQPQTFWMSQSADFENMTPDNGKGVVADDDALDFTISGDQVNSVRWLAAGRSLFIGTVGGEWAVKSDGPLITPSDIDVKRQTTFGSADMVPQQMRGRLLFLQRASRKVLEFAFSFEIDNFQALDMNLLSDHVTVGGLVDMAYQQEPDSTLWTVRADGEMPTLTYMPEQNVVGWSRCVLGGSFAGSKAVAESVSVIPGPFQDETWITVKRTVGGATKRFVEYVASPFETGDDEKLAVYCDSALTLDKPLAVSGATKADPVVVTATAHGFANGDSINHAAVAGMTELNGNTYRITDTATDTYALVAATGHKDITGATAANPVVITSAAHGLNDGDMIGIFDVLGMTELNGITYKVANRTADTFELNTAADATIDGSAFTAYTSGGKVYHAIDGTGFTTYMSGGEARLEVSSLSGLDHLEGESVTILADGAVHPARTVTSGQVTLDYAAGKVVAGLPYTHTYESLKWEAGAVAGTAQGQIKRISGVTLMLLDALGGRIGPNTGSLTDMNFRSASDAMNTAVPLFTGEKFIPFDGDFDTDTRVVVQGSAPAPFTLLAIAPEIKTNPR